jgi:ankyrin repeat protein
MPYRPAAAPLVQAGVDLETRDDRERTALLIAVTGERRGHDAYVAFVLDRTDIAVDHVNDLGWTALLEAVILGKGTERWQRIVDSLVQHGADVSIADRDGVTALQHARRLGFTEIADILERASS